MTRTRKQNSHSNVLKVKKSSLLVDDVFWSNFGNPLKNIVLFSMCTDCAEH